VTGNPEPFEQPTQQVAACQRDSDEGATIDKIVAALQRQKHTARCAMSGALKKKLGLTITSEKLDGRGRVYTLTGA
jgi:hypothetical protein